jgi:RHS repeat-associated protein
MFNAKELDEESGMYYYEARYYAPPTFISRDPLFEEKPWLNPYHYCSNNPVNKIDPTGLYDTENIKSNTDYKVIAVFQTNYAEDDHNGAITKSLNAARKAGMPIMFVDDINDFANAMQEGLADIGSSTESYTLNSHGSDGSFMIGDDVIEMKGKKYGEEDFVHDFKNDVSALEKGLNNKTVFIYACNVASGGKGKELIKNFSKKTSSTVIATTDQPNSGYRYNGSLSRLNEYTNVFSMSQNGSSAKNIYNLTIHKDNGIKYKTSLPKVSIYTR